MFAEGHGSRGPPSGRTFTVPFLAGSLGLFATARDDAGDSVLDPSSAKSWNSVFASNTRAPSESSLRPRRVEVETAASQGSRFSRSRPSGPGPLVRALSQAFPRASIVATHPRTLSRRHPFLIQYKRPRTTCRQKLRRVVLRG